MRTFENNIVGCWNVIEGGNAINNTGTNPAGNHPALLLSVDPNSTSSFLSVFHK